MNLYEEITTQWIPLAKMESASEEVYRERIEKAYSVSLPHQILTKVPYVGSTEIVEYRYSELIGLCPITFLPDLYDLTIRFIPEKYVPELKTLKYYFMDYLKIPISHEHLANRIYRDFQTQITPKQIYLYMKTAIRGGIETNIEIGEKI